MLMRYPGPLFDVLVKAVETQLGIPVQPSHYLSRCVIIEFGLKHTKIDCGKGDGQFRFRAAATGYKSDYLADKKGIIVRFIAILCPKAF
jgi:hypothetical protein